MGSSHRHINTLRPEVNCYSNLVFCFEVRIRSHGLQTIKIKVEYFLDVLMTLSNKEEQDYSHACLEVNAGRHRFQSSVLTRK